MELVQQVLKAMGEPTRLRIVAVLNRCELTVTELCRILGQSQPRVSRHLKQLCDAQILERHTQGTSAFYRIAHSAATFGLVESILAHISEDDRTIRGDLGRLASIRVERAETAAQYFEKIATEWDRMRTLHVADDVVEQEMLAAVSDLQIERLVDIGTGTGRVLEVFAEHIQEGVGLDLSQQMLNLARSRLDQLGYRHCSVRQGNAYDVPIETGTVDVVVHHHVLHFLDDPAAAIAEAARTLRANGRLLIVDFAPHEYEVMRANFSHHWLGFESKDVIRWCESSGLVDVDAKHLRRRGSETESGESLTVTLWHATRTE